MKAKEVYFNEYCNHCTYKELSENQSPCCVCLLNPYNYDSHKPIKYTGHYIFFDEYGYYKNLFWSKPYLWDALYLNEDYQFAKKYYKKLTDDVAVVGGCTSIRFGDYFGRNFDWTYDDVAEFFVRTPGIKNIRYATMGIASSLNHLTDIFINKYIYDDQFKIVPFQLVDGINSQGVVASMNVVPNNQGHSQYYIPAKKSEGEICSLMLIRYILDNFPTAKEAVEYIRDHITVYFTNKTINMGYETHILVADINNTYIMEFIDNNGKNEIWVEEISDKPYITNFRLHGVEFNNDGTVYTPETMDEEHNAIKTNHVEPLGSGLERYNYIVEHYDKSIPEVFLPASPEKSIMEFMHIDTILKDLTYTKAYPSSPNPANPAWYTEFVGARNLTVASPVEEYDPIIAVADDYYKDRSRNDGGRTWQTCHKSIYDIKNKKLYLQTQEEYEDAPLVYTFHRELEEDLPAELKAMLKKD